MMGEIWREVRSAEEIRAEEEAIRRRMQAAVDGTVRCPECGRYPKAVIFGARGRGVWVGCEASDRCCRHIVWHAEGWSLEECCEEWNRLNSGIWLFLKRVKLFFIDRFGRQARWERRERKRKLAARERSFEERKRVFGTGKVKTGFIGKCILWCMRIKMPFAGGKGRKNGKGAE